MVLIWIHLLCLRSIDTGDDCVHWQTSKWDARKGLFRIESTGAHSYNIARRHDICASLSHGKPAEEIVIYTILRASIRLLAAAYVHIAPSNCA